MKQTYNVSNEHAYFFLPKTENGIIGRPAAAARGMPATPLRAKVKQY